MTIKINTLRIDCEANGEMTASVWCDCENVEDLQVVIDWAIAAQGFADHWKKLRAETENVVTMNKRGNAKT